MCKKEVAKAFRLQKFSKNASRKNVLQVGIADVNSDTSKLLTEHIQICTTSCPAGSSTAATCPDVKFKPTKLSEQQKTPSRSLRALDPSFFQLKKDTANKSCEKRAESKERVVDFGLRNEFKLPFLQQTKITKSRVLAKPAVSKIEFSRSKIGKPQVGF